MSSLSKSLRQLLTLLLTSPTVISLLTLLCGVAGISLVWSDYTLNNEGLLTHYWASWARQDFVPVFFFQKVKPVLCALYAPISAWGARVTLSVHVLVAVAAIPMTARVARSLDQRLPNLAAFVLALSPVYFYGGPAGISNVDGTVGIVLVLYLLSVRRSPIAAGVVAGMLPWVRFELVTFVVLVMSYAFATRSRALGFGLGIFPLAYVVAGAFYHSDALWIAHFPASMPWDPTNPIYAGQLVGAYYFLEPILAVTPVAVLAVAAPLARLQRLEKALLAYLVLTPVLMSVMQVLRLGNFGSSSRYLLHLLPPLALLVSRAVEPWWEDVRPRLSHLVWTVLLATWIITRQQGEHTIPIIMSTVCTALLVSVWLRMGVMSAALVIGLVASGPLLPIHSGLIRSVVATYVDPMTEFLLETSESTAVSLYTNGQLLAPFLERRLPSADVHLMLGPDMVRELEALTNPNNGQRHRIDVLSASDLYGKTVRAPIHPDDLPSDALLMLRVDPRLPLLLPSAEWSPRLEVLVDTPEYKVARIRPPAAPAPPP